MKTIPPRPITPDEKAVLSQALSRIGLRPEAQAHLAELDGLEVVGLCECGCGSLYFQLAPGNHMIADGWAEFPDGKAANIILWSHEGRLSQLDIVDEGRTVDH